MAKNTLGIASTVPQLVGCGKSARSAGPGRRASCFNSAAARWLRKDNEDGDNYAEGVLLQQCRSPLAAESGVVGRRMLRRRAWLQQCRSPLAAERAAGDDEAVRLPKLQQCRSPLAAESGSTPPPATPPARLQQCRSPLAAERLPLRQAGRPAVRASTVPQPVGCGKSFSFSRPSPTMLASTVPQPVGCGKLVRVELPGGPNPASTVPQPVGCGKDAGGPEEPGRGAASTVPQPVGCGKCISPTSATPTSSASTVPQPVGCGKGIRLSSGHGRRWLQQCRSPLAAESSTVTAKPSSGPCFNSAAARWLRKGQSRPRGRVDLHASTVPQPVGCGKLGEPQRGERAEVASTVPQPVGCGKAPPLDVVGRQVGASTVPQPVGCGKDGLHRPAAEVDALQQCRSPLAAERPLPPPSAPGCIRLQQCRSPLAAERRRAFAFGPAIRFASTVPQPVGCGKGTAVQSSAAGDALQQCRSPLAAERTRPRSLPARTSWLQQCRSPLAAERAIAGIVEAAGTQASTVPQPVGCGKKARRGRTPGRPAGFNSAAARWLRKGVVESAKIGTFGLASTVPQPVGCGKGTTTRLTPPTLPSFNSAAARWLRKAHPNTVRVAPFFMLQQCRSPLAAESRTPPDAPGFPRTASTVPQPVGCGKSETDFDTDSMRWLQQCRSPLAAESW